MTNAISFDATATAPEIGVPAADRVLSGNPQFRTWSLDEAEGGVYAGIWEATPGSWRVVYEEWEYFSILSGYSIVTEDGGEAHHLRAGDRMVLKPGFSGSWEVVETTRKDYVVRL
ncbi:cupin domain-containing protein [Rhizobium tumorigenes]|uniref:Cupin domain-containing protein n=1 Tax=Rhizobium tumorigenes TaxID=2041385 RepID=A0AAF1K5U8_9HYPH|nr:cupin domain-containing protein [Rhizobium tumorigenes]WFR96464.1 cupin domain-containing protein [Rhizobium tumorigenes]WFS01970.1 cupin domain-containing protein [Rhizobium tumorigenes]